MFITLPPDVHLFRLRRSTLYLLAVCDWIMENQTYIRPLSQLGMTDVPLVGGKNASLGEMICNLEKHGIRVPEGFALTVRAYWDYLYDNEIRQPLEKVLAELDEKEFSNLPEVSKQAKALINTGQIPDKIRTDVEIGYGTLVELHGYEVPVAVRSSATAEDSPGASFAGQQDSYLNIRGAEGVLQACKKCFASLFSERAIKYRVDQGFKHMEVGLSVGIQVMVRSDVGASGVLFTLDPDSGFENVIVINGVWGLGENLVQGRVDPDEFVLFKPNIGSDKKSIISRKCGKKQQTMILSDGLDHEPASTTANIPTPEDKQGSYVLSDEQARQLAEWGMQIEEHYGTAMDIEWALDGLTGALYIVQARPETIHANRPDPHIVYSYNITETSEVLSAGIALGNKIAAGKARILQSPAEADKLQKGEILVTDLTNPDWEPIMKKAAAIVTNKGGRTSHAAIVAREMGVVAVVGTGDATEKIGTGDSITVSCAEGKAGKVYSGILNWREQAIDTHKVPLPQTGVMLILSDPESAFQHSFLPNTGVGLMRMEFAINHRIGIHPMALLKPDELEDAAVRETIGRLTQNYSRPADYFIDRLSQSVATVAAAFYPREVIVRMSDFKSNEYANLLGGSQFEPKEENPMLGFRGASRYAHELYCDAFQLECEAMKVVRNEMGFTNVKLMIPFCRTVEEGEKVIGTMDSFGLKRGENDLEIYVMIEIPSNVLLAEQFAALFDGFSIGSNDLTQLTLGLDRDSSLVSDLFDENNPAVKRMISEVIRAAKRSGTKIGLCGQAPSDHIEFARFLVKEGIDSISFNADALIRGIANINEAEKNNVNNEQAVGNNDW